jgi:hypothetical protein
MKASIIFATLLTVLSTSGLSADLEKVSKIAVLVHQRDNIHFGEASKA